jgi:hypothetical protein
MKKFATILSSIILAVILLSVGNGHAISLFVGASKTPGIHSKINGVVVEDQWGGTMENSILDGKKLDYLYCVDLFSIVYSNTTYANTSVNNSGTIHNTPLINADHVAYLLSKYGVGDSGDVGQALQAAIWHLTTVNTDGKSIYDLDSVAYGTNSNVVNLYNQYVTEAANNIGNIADFLWVNPAKRAGHDDYQGLVTVPPVPEPGTMMLLGFGMLGLAIYGKRRANKEA